MGIASEIAHIKVKETEFGAPVSDPARSDSSLCIFHKKPNEMAEIKAIKGNQGMSFALIRHSSLKTDICNTFDYTQQS